MKKKYRFTLIELIIALALAGILLTFLWQSFFAGQHTLGTLAIEQKKRMQQELFYLKVAEVLSCLVESKERYPLYLAPAPWIAKQMLVASYNHPHDVDARFCGPVTSAFYISSKGQLCQAIWAKDNSVRVLHLVEDVKDIAFFFFDATTLQWTDSWDSKKSRPPLFVKITLDTSSSSCTWAFTPSTTAKVLALP